MIIRELEPEEYGRIADNELIKGIPLPPPEASRIVVAEMEGQIIGYWIMVQVVHLEPVWVDPAYRGGTVLSRMWKMLQHMLDDFRVSRSFLFVDRSDTANYAERLGLEELPYKVYLYKRAS